MKLKLVTPNLIRTEQHCLNQTIGFHHFGIIDAKSRCVNTSDANTILWQHLQTLHVCGSFSPWRRTRTTNIPQWKWYTRQCLVEKPTAASLWQTCGNNLNHWAVRMHHCDKNEPHSSGMLGIGFDSLCNVSGSLLVVVCNCCQNILRAHFSQDC